MHWLALLLPRRQLQPVVAPQQTHLVEFLLESSSATQHTDWHHHRLRMQLTVAHEIAVVPSVA